MNIFYSVVSILLLCMDIRAQLPDTEYADYSTRKGMYTDTRDGRTYAYKQYGEYDWFVQNLNYAGTGTDGTTRGIRLPSDPDGHLYGTFYPTNKSTSGFCPAGWSHAQLGDFKRLFDDITGEYELDDIVTDGNKYSNIAKYLKAGGVSGIQQNGLWKSGTVIDPESSGIGFNVLPSGVFDVDDFNNGNSGFPLSADMTGNKAGFFLGGWYHYALEASNNDVLYVNRNSRHHAPVRCYRPAELVAPGVPVETPYPTEITIDQIKSTEFEVDRLKQIQKKFDHVLTGFYLPAGKSLEIRINTLQAAADGAMPRVVIGTPSRAENSRKEIQLNEGTNIISSSQHSGGMIYFRYTSKATRYDPDLPVLTGKVKIQLVGEGNTFIRAPHYVYGTTGADEFIQMLVDYSASEDVMFSSDKVAVVVSPVAARQYSIGENKDTWLETLENIIRIEDAISGIEDNDPDPLHHSLSDGIRYLFVEAGSGYMFATDFVTGYQGTTAISRMLQLSELVQNWGLFHELGHQHQQGAYKPGTFTETTVNIYSKAVYKAYNPSYRQESQERWNNVFTKYFTIDDEFRNINSDTVKVSGSNVNEGRQPLISQLFLIFGDEYYHRLHRVTREERVDGDDEWRKYYMVWNSCQVTGYDLRKYFARWGYQLLPYYDQLLDKNVESASLPEPPCVDQLPYVTDDENPTTCTLPLPCIGISTSQPPAPDIQPADQLASKNKYCDYSSKTGTFTDLRDGKQYAYKRYGDLEWFMVNLDWTGAGVYGPGDPEGKVYGRLYPTNAGTTAARSWCPSGWRFAGQSDWENLMSAISRKYDITDDKVISCIKCGGDRDDVDDGLWKKSPGNINSSKAAEVGFNMLPAGVYNIDSESYDSGDETGSKASFVASSWYHQVFTASGTSEYKNRNSNHYASVRCVREFQKMGQTISFPVIEPRTVGDDAFELQAEASSGLPVTFSSLNEKVAVVENGIARIISAGEATIRAVQEGNEDYLLAEASQKLVVNEIVSGSSDIGSDEKIKVYPNPVKVGQSIRVAIRQADEKYGKTRAKVYAADGKVVSSVSFKNETSEIVMPGVSGIYFVHIQVGKSENVYKVIVN